MTSIPIILAGAALTAGSIALGFQLVRLQRTISKWNQKYEMKVDLDRFVKAIKSMDGGKSANDLSNALTQATHSAGPGPLREALLFSNIATTERSKTTISNPATELIYESLLRDVRGYLENLMSAVLADKPALILAELARLDSRICYVPRNLKDGVNFEIKPLPRREVSKRLKEVSECLNQGDTTPLMDFHDKYGDKFWDSPSDNFVIYRIGKLYHFYRRKADGDQLLEFSKASAPIIKRIADAIKSSNDGELYMALWSYYEVPSLIGISSEDDGGLVGKLVAKQ